MLQRCDLTQIVALHQEQGRKFPLMVCALLASLLAEIKASGKVPESWEPLALCFAELHPEADAQTEAEHSILIDAFSAAGLAERETLELFLPLSRYRRLLGAAQLKQIGLS